MTNSVVDDHDEFRKTLKSFLESQGLNLLILEADSETLAVKIALREQPAVVLLELQLPMVNGRMTSELVKRVSPKSKIIILSMFDSGKLPKGFQGGRIDGCIGKSDLDSDICRVLRKLLKSGDAEVKKEKREPQSNPVSIGQKHESIRTSLLDLPAHGSKKERNSNE